MKLGTLGKGLERKTDVKFMVTKDGISDPSWRFFYHYYRQYNEMSVHFRGKCYRVTDIICQVPCETKWNKRQPNLVMRGWAKDVIITEDRKAIII